MKRIIQIQILLIVVMLSSKISHAQSAYDDAIYIRQNCYSNENGSLQNAPNLVAVLKKYYVGGKISDSTLIKKLKENPFFEDITPVSFSKSVENPTYVDKAINAVGGLDVTNISSGTASFLIKRAKQEILISVIDKLKDTKKYPELLVLFPKTTNLLNRFESWEYANFLNTLKEALDKDLLQLLATIPDLKNLSPSKYGNDSTDNNPLYKRIKALSVFLSKPEGILLISAMKVGNGITTGQKMPDIIDTLASKGYLIDIPGKSADLVNSIKLIDLLSNSFRSKIQGQNYISNNEFDNLIKDSVLTHLYFGLLYQELKNQNIIINLINIANLIGKNHKNISVQGITIYLKGLINHGADLDFAFNNLSTAKKKGEKDLSTYWASIFESTKQFIEFASQLNLIGDNLTVPNEIKTIVNDSKQTLIIANDLVNRNYSAAVVDISVFIPDKTVDEKNFQSLFVKYGSFIANVAQAKTGDDVENAIEAVALPAGSYTVKQRSPFSVSLNGYIGYSYDYNYAQGIYAPLGFSFSTRKFLLGLINWPIPTTIFFPIFDVGSVATYQLEHPSATGTSTNTDNGNTNSTTINNNASNQQIKLGSLFAPGVELFFEIPKAPFAFGFGARRTPTLTYTTSTSYLTVGSKLVFNLALLIDIPIFTLHNKSSN